MTPPPYSSNSPQNDSPNSPPNDVIDLVEEDPPLPNAKKLDTANLNIRSVQPTPCDLVGEDPPLINAKILKKAMTNVRYVKPSPCDLSIVTASAQTRQTQYAVTRSAFHKYRCTMKKRKQRNNSRKRRNPEGSDHIATMRLMFIKDMEIMEKGIKDRQELIAL